MGLSSASIFFVGLCAPTMASQQEVDFTGTWSGALTLPFDPKPLNIRFALKESDEGVWIGAFDADLFGPGLMSGTRSKDDLLLDCDLGGSISKFHLSPSDSGIQGVFQYSGFPLAISFERESEEWSPDLQIEVELPSTLPRTVTQPGLEDFWLEEIEPLIVNQLERDKIVGLAMALVIDGELYDVRSWGWSDLANGEQLGAETVFRWASISKAITGVVAAKLALADQIDLDADVRLLVPEFPKKESVVSTRLLLGHLGGIVHYGHMPQVTRTDYGVDYPFRDPVRAIDMFKSSKLIHEPGSQYSYSTHGFVLAGAALERCSERGFLGEVGRLIREPLGMESFEADDPTQRNSQRTTGYRVTSDGRVFESGDTDVSWKLAGGGFQSNVQDLAHFAVGLCDEDYLSVEERELLWTSQKTESGEETGYGLGFRVATENGHFAVFHGGAQRRTATYLLAFPDEGIAIALMCNTEGVGLAGLAKGISKIIFGEE
ncbi:MAG: CubicO group peptidase (beta-lactamase class C family) [Planctomycetota bacterium]|jgi:CubicO group peptidase (beta-lactamase class C family)